MPKFLILILFFSSLFGLTACQEEKPAPPVASNKENVQKESILLEESLEAQMVELPATALAYWNRTSTEKSPLVLFSMHPFLQASPDSMQNRARTMARSGTAEQLRLHGSIFRLDPVILSQQTASAAIEADLISRIVWFFPFKEPVEQLSLDHFKEQVVQAGFFSAEDAETLTLQEGIFSGFCKDTPIQIVHPDAYLTAEEAFPVLDETVIVHFDLSYFRGLFRSNVKTPVYQLLSNTAHLLQEMELRPRVTTLSFRTEEGEIGLSSRFLLRDLADLIENPALLEGEIPEVWSLRQEAMYDESLLEKSDAVDAYRQMAKLAPADPAVQYDQFNLHMAAGETEAALAALEKAVAKDPGYAFSYLELASYFAQNQQPDLAIELLGKAANHYPENPFIRSQTALLLSEMGRTAEAKAMVTQLLTQPWSEVYHQEARKGLEQLAAELTDFTSRP